MNVLDTAKIQYQRQQLMEQDPDSPRFAIDYRQKPDGVRNYTFMETRLQEGSEEGSEVWEPLLLPDDDEKATLFLKGKSEDKTELSSNEHKKLS